MNEKLFRKLHRNDLTIEADNVVIKKDHSLYKYSDDPIQIIKAGLFDLNKLKEIIGRMKKDMTTLIDKTGSIVDELTLDEAKELWGAKVKSKTEEFCLSKEDAISHIQDKLIRAVIAAKSGPLKDSKEKIKAIEIVNEFLLEIDTKPFNIVLSMNSDSVNVKR